jgi:hypothetical protein
MTVPKRLCRGHARSLFALFVGAGFKPARPARPPVAVSYENALKVISVKVSLMPGTF